MPPITVAFGPGRLLFVAVPQWLSTPSPLFNEGAGAQSYLITASHVTDADIAAGDVVTITYIGTTLAGSGVSFTPGVIGVAKYEYTGVGSGSISGARLLATDSALPANTAQSPVHAVTVIPVQQPSVPATGTALATLTLVSPLTGTHPFSVGQPLAKGHVPITHKIALDDNGLVLPNQQCAVLSMWSDSSARHVMLTGRLSLTANVEKVLTLRAVPSTAEGALTRTNLANALVGSGVTQVDFGAYGTAALPAVASVAPTRTYITGPQMSEWHWYVPASVNPKLGAWFNCRFFADGRVRITVLVENCILDIATPQHLTYVPTVTIGNTLIWNNGGATIQHQNYTNHKHVGWINGDPAVRPIHDGLYIGRSMLVPEYFADLPLSATHWQSRYSTLQTAAPYSSTPNHELTGGWGGGGYGADISPLSDTEVYALMSCATVDATVKASNHPVAWSMLKESARRWGVYNFHIRDANKRPLRILDYPTYSTNNSQGGTQITSAASPRFWNGYSLESYSDGHMPLGPYVAFLLTGDYEISEELYFIILNSLNCTTPNNRSNGSGIMGRYQLAQRYMAWPFRNIMMCAAILPKTGDAEIDWCANEMIRIAQNNIDWWADWHVIVGGGHGPYWNALGIPYGDEAQADVYGGGQTVSPWMMDFWVSCCVQSKDAEPRVSASHLAKLDEYLNWTAQFTVNRIADGNVATAIPRRFNTSYFFKVSDTVVNIFDHQQPWNFYTTFTECYTKTAAVTANLWYNPNASGDWRYSVSNPGPPWTNEFESNYPALGTLAANVAMGNFAYPTSVSNGEFGVQSGNQSGDMGVMGTAALVADVPIANARTRAIALQGASNYLLVKSIMHPSATTSGYSNWAIQARNSPPAWLTSMHMAEGEARPVPLANTFASQYPTGSFVTGLPGAHYNIIDSFNASVAICDDYGQHGAIGVTGGGHADWYGNESYVLDFSFPKWVRLDNPSSSPEIGTVNPPRFGWGEYGDGQPVSIHTYDGLMYLPAAYGGGAKGSMLRVPGPGFPTPYLGSHVFDLANPAARWKRFASALAPSENGEPVSCLDTRRRRIWNFSGTGSAAMRLDLDGTRVWTNVTVPTQIPNAVPGGATADHGHCFFIPGATASQDIIVAFALDVPISRIYVIYMTNLDGALSGWTLANLSTPLLDSTWAFGAAWVPDINKFVVLRQGTTSSVAYIDVPTSPGSTWNVTLQPFVTTTYNPATVITRARGPIGKRWAWYPKLKRCVLLGAAYNATSPYVTDPTPLVYRPYGISEY